LHRPSLQSLFSRSLNLLIWTALYPSRPSSELFQDFLVLLSVARFGVKRPIWPVGSACVTARAMTGRLTSSRRFWLFLKSEAVTHPPQELVPVRRHRHQHASQDASRSNREGFKHVQLRPRRLRDATKVDVQSNLFGIVCGAVVGIHRQTSRSLSNRVHYRRLPATRRCTRYARDRSDGLPRGMLSVRSNSSSGFLALQPDHPPRSALTLHCLR
jgi:hypothetical protein